MKKISLILLAFALFTACVKKNNNEKHDIDITHPATVSQAVTIDTQPKSEACTEKIAREPDSKRQPDCPCELCGNYFNRVHNPSETTAADIKQKPIVSVRVPGCSCFGCTGYSKGAPNNSGYHYRTNDSGATVTERSNGIYIPDEIHGFPVTEIEAFAFSGDYASVLRLPKTVIKIGEQAFANCENLGSITFQSTSPPEFGENVFLNIGTARNSEWGNIVVRVPPGSIPAYRAVAQLQGFDFIQFYETVNIHCDDCLKIRCECEY